MKRPVVLVILDGWGYREEAIHNAILEANTPNFDRLWKENPHTLIEASGEFVGLPDGQMGNSEIGHTTIGAGKTIDTDLVRIAKAIRTDTFIQAPAFQKLFAHIKEHNSTLHIHGMASPGGVHSHQDHLFAFLRAVKETGITKVAIHAVTDGRDLPPRSGAGYLKELEAVLAEVGIGHIATVGGRYYAMDRDTNWHRVAKAEAALFEASGKTTHTEKPSEVLESLYQQEEIDELLEPRIFLDSQGKAYPVEEHDGIFLFNFRSDRMRQFSKKLTERQEAMDLCIVSMTEYDPTLTTIDIAFPPIQIETTLATEVSKAGLTQAHIAETEKFPHVTYFLNGRRETPHEGEEHILLDSRKDVVTHDQAPEMRAEGIADAAVAQLHKGTDFVLINFANPDMVGHTGKKEAIITAVEVVDRELQKVVDAALEAGGVLVITADHGNAEVNVDLVTGETHTAHTINPVPVIMVGMGPVDLQTGSLADLAPTVLSLLGIEKPGSMTGESLIKSTH